MNRLRRLLCPIDLRRPSQAALAFAAIIADEFESVVDAVYVPEGYDPCTTRLFAPRVHAVEKLMTDHTLSEDLISLVRARAPRVSFTGVVRWGRPLRSILAEVSRRRSDIIIVGEPNQPSSWPHSARLCDALSSHAPCPVLSVPDRDPPGRPSRILLAVDHSEATDAAVEWTALLASRFEASVEVLHAARAPVADANDLRKIEDRLASSGVRTTTHAVTGASVLADVIGRSASDSIELVVIGVECGNAGRLDASFVERLRRLARVPVLSVIAKTEALRVPKGSRADLALSDTLPAPSALG